MSGFTEQTSRSSGRRPGFWSTSDRVVLTVLVVVAGLAMLALAPARRPEDAPSPPPAPRLVLDLETAPVEVLSALPGIGPALAREIDARRAEAPFLSLSDLGRRARGVGPTTLARIAPHLRFPPAVASRPREVPSPAR